MKQPKTASLTLERAAQLLTCDPEAGIIRWIKGDVKRRVASGQIAGWLNKTGYRLVEIDGVSHLVHRLIWLFVHGEFPSDILDHINGVRTDNRIVNLRIVSHSENNQNRWSVPSFSSSGLMGVQSWSL